MKNRDWRDNRSPGRRLTRIARSASILTLTLVLGAPGVGWAQGTSGVTPQSTTCNDGNVCVWSSLSYTGFKDTFNCGDGQKNVSFEARSIKNRCGNKPASVYWFQNFKGCIPAGWETPGMDRFNRVIVHPLGTQCGG